MILAKLGLLKEATHAAQVPMSSDTPPGMTWHNERQTLTDAATVSWDVSKGSDAKLTLGGSRTLAAPSNLVEGRDYFLTVVQDGTGSRTITWNAAYDFGTAGSPTLTTTASKADWLWFRAIKVGTTVKLRCIVSKLGLT